MKNRLNPHVFIFLSVIFLLSSCASADLGEGQQIPPVPASNTSSMEDNSRDLSQNPDITEMIIAQAPLLSRPLLLNNAVVAFAAAKNGAIGTPDLTDASRMGFLPIWCIDPSTSEPIHIIRAADPATSQIAYWPVQSKGWDYSYISPTNVHDENSEIKYDDSSDFQKNIWELGITAKPDLNNQTMLSTDEWDLQVWAFVSAFELIVEYSIVEHLALPQSLNDMLNGQFFLNDDFLNSSTNLILNGNSGDFEMGVVPGQNLLYSELTRRDNGNKVVNVRRYNLESGTYDLEDPARWEWVFTGVPEGSDRIILLSSKMMAEQETWINGVDHRPISDFYSAD